MLHMPPSLSYYRLPRYSTLVQAVAVAPPAQGGGGAWTLTVLLWTRVYKSHVYYGIVIVIAVPYDIVSDSTLVVSTVLLLFFTTIGDVRKSNFWVQPYNDVARVWFADIPPVRDTNIAQCIVAAAEAAPAAAVESQATKEKETKDELPKENTGVNDLV